MLRILDELLWALRRDGFTISTAQAIDVARVVALLGFEDREALRDGVASVVVERRADLDRFRRSWARFFDARRAHPDDLFGRLRERGFSDDELAALRELLEAAAERSGLGDGVALAALMGTEGELDHLLAAAGIERALAPMTSPLQTGFFTQRVAEKLGVPRAASAVARMRQALREALGERGDALGQALAEELDEVRRRVRAHVEGWLAQRLGGLDEEGARLADKAFVSLTEAELDEVRRAVRRLAEKLRGAERVRRRHARRGRIDPRRTTRESLRTGGVPFRPARTVRRRDRPRLMLLCDVSESVRTASLFMLELVYAVQELFSDARSFVFVSEIAETTALFADVPVRTALARVHGGAVVSTTNNSNYGRVFREFDARFGKNVDRRTTLVVLGDGRTNYHADEVDTVRRLRDRARALLWICPEPPGAWGTGDSAMPRYAAAVTKVLSARSAAELERAAREVVARRK